MQTSGKNTTNNERQSVDSTRNIQRTLSTFYNRSSIYGSGQEAGNFSTNWIFYSTPMMKALEKHCEDCTITNPARGITYTKHILGFFNDKHNMQMIGKAIILQRSPTTSNI